MTSNAGWEGILDEGEHIIWQGRPDAKIIWKVRHIFTFLFGLAFAGFALFWMVMASQAGGLFWAFGLVHFSVGLGLAIGPPFWNAWRRRHTWYSLSDRRAFIASDLPLRGRKLKSYPITEDTMLEFDLGDPASIHFAHEYRRSRNGSNRVPIGFDRIPDGEDVYAKIRKIQQGAA